MKYLLTGLGKGTYNSGNPISADKIWKTYVSPIKLSEIDQGGATDGDSLGWNTLLGKWAPARLGSKWTESGGNIYRNSQVTIGQDSLIDSELGIKQNNINGAVRIDALPRSTRRTVESIYEGTTLRYSIDNYGIPIWRLFNGATESGSLAFTTPSNGIGILTANNDSFGAQTRGSIIWYNNTADTGLRFEIRGGLDSRLRISGTGRFGYYGNFVAGISHAFSMISGDTIISRFYNGSIRAFTVFGDGTIQTDHLFGGVWKLGLKVDATVSLDTTKYITVQVDGVEYKLALANV